MFRNFFSITGATNDYIPQGRYYLPPEFHAFKDNLHNHWCVDIRSCEGLIHAYRVCAPLSTTINMLALAYSNARIWVVDEDDKDIEAYDWVKDLFLCPNPLMVGRQLLLQVDQYVKIFGNGFILKVPNLKSEGRPILNIWPLNPCWMRPRYKTNNSIFDAVDITDIIDHWEYCHPYSGQIIRLDPKDVLHLKDVSLNLNSQDHHYTDSFQCYHLGESRICGLEDHIKNIVVAAKAIYGLNIDRGAQGILSPQQFDAAGYVPYREDEKIDLQKQLLGFYGVLPGQSKVIMSPVPMDWKPMSYSVKDLMLYDGIQENIQRIADAYFLPYDLLAHAKGTTFNNKSESEKRMYQDAIIPNANMTEQSLTSFLGVEGGKVQFDYSHVYALQESEKEKEEAKTIRTNRAISLYNINLADANEVRMAADMSMDFDQQEIQITEE